MTKPQSLLRRSLQTRLTLYYAAGIYAAGIIMLLIVDIPLVRIQSTTPAGSPSSRAITQPGHSIGPRQLLTGSVIALVILVPVALAVGWFVAGRFLRPLRTMTATAKGISAGNLHQRLDLGEPSDELTDLGRTLDDLFTRLQAAFDAQRHFVANASHELRTPLAGLRTLLEVTLANPDADADTLRATCREALALSEHQAHLIDALHALASSERGISHRLSIDLAHIARRVLPARRDQATNKAIRLIETLAPGPTNGDPKLIESLITNLIDNSIRHNHRGGFIKVSTQTLDTQAILTITNSGPVIPVDQLQRLRQPFQRLSPDRRGNHGGYGLGLAIVEAVTQAHNATLSIHARPEGGLDITVTFPAEQPDRTEKPAIQNAARL